MQQQDHAQAVTKRAFLRAVCSGDIATIERFFQQPSVVQAVLEDERRVQTRETAQPLQYPPGAALPWYVGNTTLIFVDEGTVAPDEVFQWFFCGPLSTHMPHTLAAITTSGLLVMLSEHGAAASIELVLTSIAFQDPFMNARSRSTCLDLAATIAANVSALDVLIAHGASISVDTLGVGGVQPGGRKETISSRVKNGAIIVGNATIIGHAIVLGASADMVRTLISLGADARSLSPSPIHRAVSHGKTDVIKTLIMHGVVNFEAPHSSPQSSPLLMAVYGLSRNDDGIRHNISELLAGGADPNVRGPEGLRPVHIAAERGGRMALLALLCHGADPNATCGVRGRTPLHVAAETADARVNSWHLKHLLRFHADPNIRDARGSTALHVLAARPREPWIQDAITRLVQAGADLLAMDGAAQTPLGLLQRDPTGRRWADALLRHESVVSDR